MFNVGPEKILLILFIALIVLGPNELPRTARKIGNVVGEWRRMSAGFEAEIRSAFDDVVTHDPAAPSKESAVKESAVEPSTEIGDEGHESDSAA